MFREIKHKKFKDSDPQIIAWQREDRGALDTPLMYIFPQRGDNIKEKKFFAVKDYEKAIFYNKGALVAVLGGGIYELDKNARIKGTEIVWIDTSMNEIPWGIPQSEGIPTKDGYIIGLYGDLKLKISDPKIFYNDVVAGTKIWSVHDLKKWIISLLHTSLRDIFKNYNAKSIILEDRDRVINLITSKVTEEFLRYGLELETFNVIGIKAPDDAEKLFKEDKERIEYFTKQKKDLKNHIEDLKNKLQDLQDLLIKDEITQEDYDKKKKQIHTFIEEAQDELKKLNESI